jgi:hypothetical protein
MENLKDKLSKLWRDFDYTTARLRENLDFGGELTQEQVDKYNYFRSEIIRTREEVEKESK